uniref:Reverse transcriptase domain-containing protein n=1 Tax=Tanacetum cinerariifolium TaxID=118510 RepID=A0A6L2K3V3_TANCI|nr:hypothetical protein [Tanacetum cinerariifolium]
MKGGNKHVNQSRQPFRVLQNPSADVGSSTHIDDTTNVSTLPKEARVIQDNVTDHVNPLNNEYHGLSASVKESNLRSVMNPSSETEYDVKENVWSGNLAGITTSQFGSNNSDPSLPKGVGIRVLTQAGRFVSTLSCMDNTGPSVVSLFTRFGDVPLGSSFTTIVPDDIGASSKPTSSKQDSATKGEASKFMFTKVDNVFEGVDISMPHRMVKFHDVPLEVFDERRSSFARCLIEVSSDEPLKENITIGIPLLEGEGYSKEVIRVEYEWKPPRCDKCKIFGHFLDSCSRNIKAAKKVDTVDDGFQQVSRRKKPSQNVASNLKTQGSRSELQPESHVDVSIVYDTCQKVCKWWKWISNGSLCNKGSRIILDWNDDIVDVGIMSQTNLVMHVQISVRASNKALFCSFVYADNYYIDQIAIWLNLEMHYVLMRDKPWTLMGDFKAPLNLEDHSCGGYELNVAMRYFKECVNRIEVMDINCIGLYFTWNQKPKGSNGVLKKIDRIMGNLKFNDDYPGSFAIFQLYHISDHSSCILRIPKVPKPKPKPFKFSNFLINKDGFRQIVEAGCNLDIDGFNMYRVVKWLKGLKSHFRKLLHDQGNLHDRVIKLHFDIDEAQKAIDKDPSSSALCEEHAHYLVAFKEAVLDEECFLKQKSKVEWLNTGDSNTAYFHRIVKRGHGFGNQECCVFHGDDKAPGPDGFTTAFFKKAWDVVGTDITCAIRVFFVNGKLLKELNYTSISLIPKVTTPDRINDYRHISCCNVLYKCISKIIANLLKEGLGDLVSINQSAFVPGRRISDNILLTQELMRNYHRKRGPPRCAFKVDIQKACDTVDWSFLRTILLGFGFHITMVQWIMACVTGASFFVCVNGNLHGWFNGKRKLRQGDPLLPYLFTLVMEVLTLILQLRVRNSNVFQGNPSSVSVIMDALEEFNNVSGLVLSIPKSTAFFCNVPNAIKAAILSSMPFVEGTLPVRVQLIRSVLYSMHIYFASIFILPARIIHDLEQLMCGFLWCQEEMKKGKGKVVGESVCKPKTEGGLDIQCIDDFNIALMITHIWCLLTYKESLWVKWVHSYKLNGRNFWDVPCLGDKLKIQDRLWQWDVSPSIDLNLLGCPLCNMVPDSHDHLFFECSFSSHVWSKERNGRLFKKKISSPNQIVHAILSMVRLKLVTFKFKMMSTRSRMLLDRWKIPSYCVVHDGSFK